MKISSFLITFFIVIPLSLMSHTQKLFNGDDELPNSLITSLAQDSLGNIWIGTENGLCKYDGAKFRHYFHNSHEGGSLLSNLISDILVTSDGRLCVGTPKGLQIFNAEYNRFDKISLVHNGTDTVPIHVSSIRELKNGNLLLCTLGHGIFKVDLSLMEGISISEPEDQNSFPVKMSLDADDNVWISMVQDCAKRGIWRNNNLLEIQSIPGTNDWKVKDIVTDAKGDAYYCTQNGVYKVLGEDMSHQLVISYDVSQIVSALMIKDNILLFGTETGGLLAYNIKEGRFVIPKFSTGTTVVSKIAVSTLLLDKAGNLWLGLYKKGVLECPSQSSQFEYIGSENTLNYGIAPPPVMALYAATDGILWVAADNDGLYAISSNGVTHYSSEQNGLPTDIACIFQSSDGTIWIGAYDKGLLKFDQEKGSCKYIDGFKDTSVFDILEDNQKRLWVATRGDGLYQTDLNGNIKHKVPLTDPHPYAYSSSPINHVWINSLTLSKEGEQLFINTCTGIICLNLNNLSFDIPIGLDKILAGEMCYDSYLDSDENLWIATSNGVYKWQSQKDMIEHYDTANGLCNNSVVGVIADSNDNIWFATYYGLSKYDKTSSQFINYYVQDGLQGNEFSLRSIARDPNGKIYAGGLNGITAFSEINKETKKPKIRIADIYLHDEPIDFGTLSNGKPIIQKKGNGELVYELDVEDNSIGIEFTSDLFLSNVHFQYSLDSANWITLPNGDNKVYFSNLSPGKHLITFQGIANDITSDSVSIMVMIRPLWYLTWWMIAIYCVLAFCLIFFIYMILRNRHLMKTQIEQQRKREEINESTMDVLVNMAHEIRTPISLITNPIERLSEKHTDAESRHLFSIIHNNINRLLMLLNQLLDLQKFNHNQMTLNRQPVEMVRYIRQTMALFEDMSVSKHINLTLYTQVEEVFACIDPYQFDKIIVNLLSNAFKFTKPNGNISISITLHDSQIGISVTNEGPRIPEDEIVHIFERFYQAPNNWDYSHLGSGVGLHLTHLLVTMHQGSIKAINNPDGSGVSFIVEIPALKDTERSKIEQYQDNVALSQEKRLPVVEEDEYELEAKNLKSRATIVILEDSVDIRQYLHEELQTTYNIVSYDNVKDAWGYVVSNKPDLIITDIMLPDGNGIELIKRVRQNINNNDLPIIVLSAKSTDEDIMECIDNGADAYMTKPFKIKVLRSYIENLLTQRHRLKVIYKGNQIDENVTPDISEIKSSDEQLKERLTNAINANLANPDYTIADLASDVGISRMHLNRKLKELTNQSPSTYLRNMRLAKAAEILRGNPAANVGDVAAKVGMPSFSHFSHAFKELYGCSPSEYAVNSEQ